MGVAQLAEKLRADGKKQEKAILAEAQKQIREKDKKFEQELAKEVESILQSGKRKADATSQQIIGQANLVAQQTINQARIEVLDEVYELARDQVESLGEAKQKKLLLKLASDTNKINAANIQIGKKYLPLLEKGKLGKGISISPSDETQFGLIIADESGKVRIDHRLPAVLDELKHELQPQLISTLFNQSKATKT